jgi:hypothetical protein
MALEGRIVDFGVADILQLISQQQKTGVLLVDRPGENIEVLFWNGMIISAHPVAKVEKELLGEKLVKSGLISPDQLHRALDIQEDNLQHLGEILVAMGILGKEMLDRIIRNQIYDTFSELFQWKEGSYAFHAKSVTFNENVFTPLALEHIILDVLRMMDEWPDIMKAISSMTTIFKKSDRSFSEGDEVLDEKMSHEQRIVFNLVDGLSNVQGVVDKSLLGKFTTAKALKEILGYEYIEAVLDDSYVIPRNKSIKYMAIERALVVGGYLIFALLLMSLMTVTPPDVKSTFGFFLNKLDPPTSVLANLEYTRLEKIKHALQIYFWERRKYPNDLDELVAANILSEEQIVNSSGESYYYISKGNSYSLQ